MSTVSKVIASVIAVFATNQAFAIDTDKVVTLPTLQGVAMTSTPTGGLAAVQPQGLIKFTYRSCGTRQFEAELQEVKGVLFVSIIDKIIVDCGGPTFSRPYSVQYSSDSTKNERVVILNPQTLFSDSLF